MSLRAIDNEPDIEVPEEPTNPTPPPEPRVPPPAEPDSVDEARAEFDAKLAAVISRKNLEIIELRISLARADEARRSYLNILVCLLFFAGWLWLWSGALHRD